MGSEIPKQFLILNGLPVIMHTIQKFAAFENLQIILVLPQSQFDYWEELVKTYKFIVGSTAGSYQMTVGLPNWDTAATKASAKTVAFKIASDGAVSNADVLKSIVSLIASINKQIQALQKLILRR